MSISLSTNAGCSCWGKQTNLHTHFHLKLLGTFSNMISVHIKTFVLVYGVLGGFQGLRAAALAPYWGVPCVLSGGTHLEVSLNSQPALSVHRRLLWRRRAKCLSRGRIHLPLFIWSITSLTWPIQMSFWPVGRQLSNRLDPILTG